MPKYLISIQDNSGCCNITAAAITIAIEPGSQVDAENMAACLLYSLRQQGYISSKGYVDTVFEIGPRYKSRRKEDGNDESPSRV